MINFIEQENLARQKKNAARRKMVVVFTACMGVYAVIVSGYLGWKTTWIARQKLAQSRMEKLSSQLKEHADKEAAIRYAVNRAEYINKIIEIRGQFGKQAKLLVDPTVTVNNWSSDTSGLQQLSISTNSQGEIDVYTQNQIANYSQVVLKNLSWSKDGKWIATIELGGIK